MKYFCILGCWVKFVGILRYLNGSRSETVMMQSLLVALRVRGDDEVEGVVAARDR